MTKATTRILHNFIKIQNYSDKYKMKVLELMTMTITE